MSDLVKRRLRRRTPERRKGRSYISVVRRPPGLTPRWQVKGPNGDVA